MLLSEGERGSSPILKQIAVTFQAFRLEYFEKKRIRLRIYPPQLASETGKEVCKYCVVRVLAV